MLKLDDDWVAYQLDNAVTMFGITIENALEERVNIGDEKNPQYAPKYTLTQLLADDFRLPAPVVERPQGLQGLMNMPGVKVHKAG